MVVVIKHIKPPRDEKPSELITVCGVRGGYVCKYFPLICLIACFIVVVNFILNIF